ncbi:MAG: hypothetical protein JO016_16100 [Actinobacteria bacterium]|nr:hypothetical protein [Actinomycetota bacterium]
MNPVEDRLREALAARAAQSPVDPDAWDKAVARSRHRVFPWRWPAWVVRLVPVAAVAVVAGVVIAATTLGQSIGQGARPAGSASTKPASPHPSASLPAGMASVVDQIPPATPFVPISLRADGHQVRVSLWFGYVPADAAAGLALCQYDSGGAYSGYSTCTSGQLPAGKLAQWAQTDGTGWIHLGVAAPQVTSVTALLPGGQTVQGTVRAVRGVADKVWAVSHPADSAAMLVFRDAAGHVVARLTTPKPSSPPSRPSQGGIPLFRYGNDTVTGYRISGDRIGFFEGGSSSWSDTPISQSALSVNNIGVDSGPDDLYGYAPTGTARVAVRLADGRLLTSPPTIAGWPGSGVVFWGPVALPAHTGLGYDTIVITYDRAGHVLREVPLLFTQ